MKGNLNKFLYNRHDRITNTANKFIAEYGKIHHLAHMGDKKHERIIAAVALNPKATFRSYELDCADEGIEPYKQTIE